VGLYTQDEFNAQHTKHIIYNAIMSHSSYYHTNLRKYTAILNNTHHVNYNYRTDCND